MYCALISNFVSMKIEKHLSSLLYRYQCVTVPGFGAFLTETKPAYIDIDTNTFYPPKKVISFNANLKNNDGLLANHIALQEKISYDYAVIKIEQAVAGWNSVLLNEDLSLNNVGSISRNNEGNLLFTPDSPVNYLTAAFGLANIISPAIKREAYKIEAEDLKDSASITFKPERRSGYAYLKYAAVFAVVAFAGASGFKVYHDREVAAETLLVEKAVQEKIQSRIQQATFFIDNPFPAVPLTVKEEIKPTPYHIIAGAYKSKANAQKAASQLSSKGFNPHIFEKNKFGLFTVSYNSYTTLSEAQQNMSAIHRSHNRDAWLLIKEL